MSNPLDSGSDYAAHGVAFGQARDILDRGCAFPPSLEVFKYGLYKASMESPTITPQSYARHLVDTYNPVKGLFS